MPSLQLIINTRKKNEPGEYQSCVSRRPRYPASCALDMPSGFLFPFQRAVRGGGMGFFLLFFCRSGGFGFEHFALQLFRRLAPGAFVIGFFRLAIL
ncbi:MAG: hypothetical protein CMM62_02170 [Rhodospirillaceae bacterium]|nr:hypothetical protein [Rhodospirillaceae bacterium]